jgi:predicted N-acyltransferase
MPRARTRILDSLAEVPAPQWDALAGDHPLLSYAFLDALHDTGCAADASGWSPSYITLWDDDALVAAMPLYSKEHSYGEYVFDWAWADAYERHGMRYYPKLLCAIPFTPATGPRLLAPTAPLRRRLVEVALALAREQRTSSLHVLFPVPEQAQELEGHGMMLRTGVQFHWRNPGYRDFADYLSRFNHDKRKKINQERRRVQEAGVEFVRLSGREATSAQWDFFFRCYTRTYREHHSTPYLNRRLFERLVQTMPDQLLLVIGMLEGKAICAALNIHNTHTLYGRYWGATQFVPGLHFETCYYQAIEFCIERGLALFEGGAQGEHKLARGFLPERTYSAHWLAHPQFAHAVEDFLNRETRGIAGYVDELNEHTPYKSAS